jgi:hypothetical protein
MKNLSRRINIESFLNYKGEGRINLEFPYIGTSTLTLEQALVLLGDLRQEIDLVQRLIREKQDQNDLQG